MKKLLLVAVLAIVGAVTGCNEAKFPYLTSIAVSPGSPSVTAGATQQFTAQGTFSNGATRDLTSLVTWGSSTTSVASIVAGGLATTSTQGSSTISASFTLLGGAVVTGSTTLTVTAPPLTSIQVSPATASVAEGRTQQFTAQGTFSNGTTSDITSQVTWSSSNTSVASIVAGGLATGHTPGSSTITASFTQANGTVTGTATLTVKSLTTVTSIQISPATPSVAAGATQQFTAQGTLANGTTRDITSEVTWSSSTIYVASIAAGGLASTHSQGSSTITASFTQTSGTVTGTATLTVTAPGLVSIVITDNSIVIPGPNSVANVKTAAGTSHQFSAHGIYTDGGIRNITGSVRWTSVSGTVAKINGSGRATGLTPGTATITATDPATSLTQNVSLVVTNATVTAIVVWPANQTIAPLTRLSFAALGEFSDGTTQDLTTDATWSSTNTAVATAAGSVATSVAAGSTMMHAVFGGKTGSASLNVTSATPVSLALTPSTAGVAIGTRLALQAVATFSDGTKHALVVEVTWSITPSDGSIATVNQNGVVTGVAAGTATVKAQFGTLSSTATVNVQNFTSISAAKTGPISALGVRLTGLSTIAAGTATGFRATATLTDGTTQDVTSDVTWVSTDPATAIITDVKESYSGWATGIAAGNDTIAAVFNGQYVTIPLTVTNATLTSIAISPAAAQSIALGSSLPYRATGKFSDSTTQDLTFLVTWTSSDPPVAVINIYGVAASTGAGSTMVKAAANINGSTASDDKALTVH